MHFILLTLLINPTLAHTKLDCTHFSNGLCHGYTRYYSTLSNQFDRFLSDSCNQQPYESYTQQYPMAQVSPGQRIWMRWAPRGHAQQQSSNVWVYLSTTPSVVTSNTKSMILVGESPYNDCEDTDWNALLKSGINTIGRVEGDSVSWGTCFGSYVVPVELSKGVYSGVWEWELSGVIYRDCFEVKVK